jgi:hypothetical protein
MIDIDKILRKQYRFQKQNLFNEEVFKIKLNFYLDQDLEQCEENGVEVGLLRSDFEPITLEEVKTWADKIRNSQELVSSAESSLEFTKTCENYDEWDGGEIFDLEDLLDCEVDSDELKKLFPNTIEFLIPYGIEP